MASNSKEQEQSKYKNLNMQLTREIHEELQEIADQLGGMSLSALMRMVIHTKLVKYRETGDPTIFLDKNI